MYNILVFFLLLGAVVAPFQLFDFTYGMFCFSAYSSDSSIPLWVFSLSLFSPCVCVCVFCLASYRFQNESSFNSCLSIEMEPKFENYTFTIDWIGFCYDRKQNTVDSKHIHTNNETEHTLNEDKKVIESTQWVHDLLFFDEKKKQNKKKTQKFIEVILRCSLIERCMADLWAASQGWRWHIYFPWTVQRDTHWNTKSV